MLRGLANLPLPLLPPDQVVERARLDAGEHAVELARSGVSISVTQKLLGHSSPLLTAKHYTKLEDGDVRAAVELGAVGGGREDVGGRDVGA